MRQSIRPALQEMLAAGADKTFNCITIDSDTSTSDTVLLSLRVPPQRAAQPAIKDAIKRGRADFCAPPCTT